MSKYNRLKARVEQLEKKQMNVPCKYSGYYILNRDDVINMLIKHLDLEYDPGETTKARFVKCSTTEQLKRSAGLKD